MLKTIILHLLEDVIRGLSGPLGIRLRRFYYTRRLRRCGAGVVIEPGVMIIRPEWVSLGDHVWLDRNVTLIAGPPGGDAEIENKPKLRVATEPGEIVIGDHSHVGIGTIIQGHGGVLIGKYFTSSPHAKVYSFSNDYRKTRRGTMRSGSERQFYKQTPVTIEDNVWLGIDTVVIGHTIGCDTFVRPGSIVSANIPANSLACGAPAARIAERFPEAPAERG